MPTTTRRPPAPVPADTPSLTATPDLPAAFARGPVDPTSGEPTACDPAAAMLDTMHKLALLYNDLVWNTKLAKEPLDAEFTARAISAITASYGVRNLCRRYGDVALERTLSRIAESVAKPPRALRINPKATPRDRMLRELLRALFLLNPERVSTAALYNSIARLEGEVSIATRMLPTQGAMQNLRSTSAKPHRLYLNDMPVTRHNGAMPAEPVYPADATTTKPGSDELLPHPLAGRTYYMTPMCDTHGHGRSPLYAYHATAWAMQQYANYLIRFGFDHCPILPHLSVAWLTYSNSRDLGAAKSTRFLIEAKRHYQRLMKRGHIARSGKYVQAGESVRACVLPMYWRWPAEEGADDVFGLYFVHDCEPWGNVQRKYTTAGELRLIIMDECDKMGVSYDELDLWAANEPEPLIHEV